MPTRRNMPLTQTRRALAEYDASAATRDLLWQLAETNDDVANAIHTDREAEARVKEAFAHDTADINSRDRAMLVTIADVRRLLALEDGR